MSWVGLAVRGAGQILFGVMAGMELKDSVRTFLGGASAPAASSSSGSASASGSEVVVAVVSQDPNTWVVLGRLIGITLAILEAGKLLASGLVAHEVKRSTEFFQKCREEAYTRLELDMCNENNQPRSPPQLKEL